MDHTLNGKIALVTGGGRGIGAAIALKLAGLGATTIVCGRTLARLQHTAGQIRSAGGQGEAMACDVADWNSVAALADRVQKTFGRLDILVNNAGIGTFGGPLHTMPTDKWDAMFNTNLRGVFYMIRAFAPMMISGGGGDIVNISSLAGKNPVPNGAAYSATKWGLNGLTLFRGRRAARAQNPGGCRFVLDQRTRNLARMKARARKRCWFQKMWPTQWRCW